MATKGEKKALMFLGAVLLLGTGVRLYVGTHHSTSTQQTQLDRQIRTVDSLKTIKKREKKQPKRRAGKSRKSPGDTTSIGLPLTPETHPIALSQASAQIDMDTAPQDTLERLSGIGPKLAATIVADRAKSGPFHSLEGLQRVRGIGPALAEKLRPHVTFSGRSR